VCKREIQSDEALIRERRFKDRTLPFSSVSVSWGFLISRSFLSIARVIIMR
jgi:hypothetical protein